MAPAPPGGSEACAVITRDHIIPISKGGSNRIENIPFSGAGFSCALKSTGDVNCWGTVLERHEPVVENRVNTVVLSPDNGADTAEFIPDGTEDASEVVGSDPTLAISHPDTMDEDLLLELDDDDDDDDDDENVDSIGDVTQTQAPPSIGETDLSNDAGPWEPESVSTRTSLKSYALLGLVLFIGIGGGIWASQAWFQAADETEMVSDDEEGLGTVPVEVGAVSESIDGKNEAVEDAVPSVDSPATEVLPEPSPTPASAPAAAPESEPPSAPAPGPEPEKKPVTVPKEGTVDVKRDADIVDTVLISRRGKRLSPGTVPVGTYDLEVRFSSGEIITRTGFVKVQAGKTTRVVCSSISENCRVK